MTGVFVADTLAGVRAGTATAIRSTALSGAIGDTVVVFATNASAAIRLAAFNVVAFGQTVCGFCAVRPYERFVGWRARGHARFDPRSNELRVLCRNEQDLSCEHRSDLLCERALLRTERTFCGRRRGIF